MDELVTPRELRRLPSFLPKLRTGSIFADRKHQTRLVPEPFLATPTTDALIRGWWFLTGYA